MRAKAAPDVRARPQASCRFQRRSHAVGHSAGTVVRRDASAHQRPCRCCQSLGGEPPGGPLPYQSGFVVACGCKGGRSRPTSQPPGRSGKVSQPGPLPSCCLPSSCSCGASGPATTALGVAYPLLPASRRRADTSVSGEGSGSSSAADPGVLPGAARGVGPQYGRHAAAARCKYTRDQGGPEEWGMRSPPRHDEGAGT
jgi:hypothetical protein